MGAKVKKYKKENNPKKNISKFCHKSYLTHMLVVFNLAQLSAILISFRDLGLILAYFLKFLTFNILFIVLTISKKLILLFKNKCI